MKYISLLLLFFCQSGFAAPRQYVLEGSVRGIYGEDIAAENLNLSVGDYVRYVILVDTEVRGYSDISGVIECQQDYADGYATHLGFYAELIDISYEIAETYYNSENINYSAYTIDSPTYPDGVFTRLIVGPEKLYFDSTTPIEEWQIGEAFGGAHWWHNQSTMAFRNMHLDLTLAEIGSWNSSDYSICGSTGRGDYSDPEPPHANAKRRSGGGTSFLMLVLLSSLYLLNRVGVSKQA